MRDRRSFGTYEELKESIFLCGNADLLPTPAYVTGEEDVGSTKHRRGHRPGECRVSYTVAHGTAGQVFAAFRVYGLQLGFMRQKQLYDSLRNRYMHCVRYICLRQVICVYVRLYGPKFSKDTVNLRKLKIFPFKTLHEVKHTTPNTRPPHSTRKRNADAGEYGRIF